MQTLTQSEIPVAIAGDGVEVRTTEVGDMTASFIRLAKGTDLGPALVGLADDRCQCPHWGYMLEGRLLMRTPGGDHVYHAGQAFYWAPGHVPVALEDASYVDFSPTEEFAAVIGHIRGES
jgi:hypothetical protein